MNPEYINDFVLETKEHIESIETLISSLEHDMSKRELVDGLFRDFHTIKGLAGFVSLGLVQKIAHQTESLLDLCRKSGAGVDEETLTFAAGAAELIKSIVQNLSLNDDPDFNGVVMNFLGGYNSEEIEKGDEEAIAAVVRGIIEQDAPAPKSENVSPDFVRIPMQKIDFLADTVGELLINCSQFEQDATELQKNERLNMSLRRVVALTKQIQRVAMSLRMVSLRQLFLKIEKMGRDTILRLSKNAEIILHGEETELDRGIVEKLADPLVHLIKNSIYHGIEDREHRINTGKPPVGSVTIQASRRRDGVFIEVSDDGRGIDTDAVFKKAVENCDGY